jgi:hypothetical protein
VPSDPGRYVLLVLVIVSGGVVEAARRAVAFRADYAGLTLGAAPGQLSPRGREDVFVPWADVEQIILYQTPGRRAATRHIGIQRRAGAPALAEGNERAPGWPVPGVAVGATRRVTGWRLDRDCLAAVTAVVAPGIPVTDISGIEGAGQATSPTELEPPG